MNIKFLSIAIPYYNGFETTKLILDELGSNDESNYDIVISDDCSLENLRLICSNCDTLTPTYKGRNKGNGRFSRRQRYQEGKSF